MRLIVTSALILALAPPLHGQDATPPAALQYSIDELRSSVGVWDVTTTFLGTDGSADRVVEGTYEFEWVVPDRVISGKSVLPSLGQSSAILFYVRPEASEIEMVSVGDDGRLWIMTGPLGGDVRQTAAYDTPSGGRGALRFTRFNVTGDSFESKMEYTADGGQSWSQGNHQHFRRRS